MKPIPNYVLRGLTLRQWKAKKRRELRAVVTAFKIYRNGCAYCPGVNGEVGNLNTILDSLTRSHSAREWGR